MDDFSKKIDDGFRLLRLDSPEVFMYFKALEELDTHNQNIITDSFKVFTKDNTSEVEENAELE